MQKHPSNALAKSIKHGIRAISLCMLLATCLSAVDQNGGHRGDNFTSALGGDIPGTWDYSLLNPGNGDANSSSPSLIGSLSCSYQESTDVRVATLLKVTRKCNFNIVVTIDLNMSWYNTVNPLANCRGFGYGQGKAFNGSDLQADRSAMLAVSSEPFTGSVPIPGTGVSVPIAWNTGTGTHTSPGMTGTPGVRTWQPNLSHSPGTSVSDIDAPVVEAISASSHASYGTAATVNVRITVTEYASNPAVWQFPEP